jgi:hypothetical protein
VKPIESIGKPLFVPENRRELGRLPAAVLEAVAPEVAAAAAKFLEAPTAAGFLEFEESALRILQHAASHVVAGVVGLLHRDPHHVQGAVDAACAGAARPLRHRGVRGTPVRFLGGACLVLATPYLSEDLRWRPGAKRGVGRRQATGTGCYPVLAALGIARQATPALASEVTRQSVRAASFEEAQQALAERGIGLDRKTVRTLALKVGEEALVQREARIEAAAEGAVRGGEFAGRRIVISTDGGRLRLREGGKRGRKGKKGRRRYRTPWREPKVVIAYAIDAKGRRDRSVPAFYDGTLGNADAAFEILVAELKLRGAAEAQEIILTADGARWIWNRADALARALGLPPERIVKVADFYHGVEHLSAVAELRTRWTDDQRKRWVRRMRRHLRAGRVDTVIEAIRTLCRGRNAAKIGVEMAYFADRRDLMRYDHFRRCGIPMGSGAVESAIRRVVNLRLKGPSIFWRGRNAERMLHLRCYLKAGRWDELMRRALFPQAEHTRSQEIGRLAA